MKKRALFATGLSLCLFLTACGEQAAKAPTAAVSSSQGPAPSSASAAASANIDASEKDMSGELENIKVSAALDEAMGYEKVIVENQGTYIFTGDIHIRFYNSNNKIVGRDMMIVESLAPGNRTWANISVSELGELSLKYEFADSYEFTVPQLADSSDSPDEAWSAELTESMSSFQTASWYSCIETINVYKGDEDRDATVIVLVNTNTTDEQANRIGNAVFGNFAFGDGSNRSFDVVSVSVQLADGTELFLRTK